MTILPTITLRESYRRSDDHDFDFFTDDPTITLTVFLPKVTDDPTIIFRFFCRKLPTFRRSVRFFLLKVTDDPTITFRFFSRKLPTIRRSYFGFFPESYRRSQFGFFPESCRRSDDHISVFLPKKLDTSESRLSIFFRETAQI